MTRIDLLDKLKAIKSEGITVSINVEDIIKLIEELDDVFAFENLARDIVTDDLVKLIAETINQQAIEIIDEYQLSMYGNEVQLDSIEFMNSLLEKAIRGVVEDVFDHI
jgi:hypothetical protein